MYFSNSPLHCSGRMRRDVSLNSVSLNDIGFDVDDAGALAVANHLQDQRYFQLLGVVHNTGFHKGIGAVDVINNYNERRELDLGGYRDRWASSSDAQNAQDT